MKVALTHRIRALRGSLSTALANLRQKTRDRFILTDRGDRRYQTPGYVTGDPAPRRVYEDDHIIAFLEENESAFLVVTFGDRVNLADGEKFFGDVPLRKMGFSALGIMAKSPHWYQTGSIPKMVAATQNLLSRYPERIGYGGSMGGYAALKYAAHLNLTTTISLCPQFSIDDDDLEGVSTVFSEFFRESMRGMKIGSDCASGKAFVFYDPSHAEDAHHANLIKATLPNCSLVRVWMIGHGVTTTLAGSETLKDLIAACRVEDLIRIRAVVAKKRRIGGQRLFRLTDRLMTKHGRLFLKYLIPFSFNGNRWASEQVRTVSKQMRSRITSFLASHDPQLLKTYDKSLALAETAWLSEAPHRYWSEEQALIRFKQCCIPDSRTDAREVSGLPDGQYLVFDFLMLMLRCASKSEMLLCQCTMCPVKLTKAVGPVQLVCRPHDIDHPLTHMNPGNFFGLSPAARSSDSIRLEVENEGSGVTIFDAGRGLIVETGGKLSQARQGGSERSLFDLVECPSEQDTHFIRLT